MRIGILSVLFIITSLPPAILSTKYLLGKYMLNKGMLVLFKKKYCLL